MEIGTHPDDLQIICAELKENPGKWFLGIFRGRGHNYKALLTSDVPESWQDSKEKQLDVLKAILIGASLQVFYHAASPATFEAFEEEARKRGYTDEWIGEDKELLRRVYDRLVERGGPSALLRGMIDPDRALNAAMISEIMERLQTSDSVDTSVDPLKAFTGPPTSPPHRLEFYEKLGKH